MIPPERIWILTNDHLREIIVRQLPEVPAGQILAEPAQRNTAPAIGLAAHILDSIDPEAVMGVFPADHVIGKPAAYRAMLRAAFKAAEAGQLMVVGIQPRWPETGYGYIEFPAEPQAGERQPAAVQRFREKPACPEPRRYLAAGNYFWNSGMFFWRAARCSTSCARICRRPPTCWPRFRRSARAGFAARLEGAFPAVREHLHRLRRDGEGRRSVTASPAGDFGWNDVGSWNANPVPRRVSASRKSSRTCCACCRR